MAWARDKNGKEVWLDESGVLPPMAREELDRPMPLPDWPGGARRHQPGVKVPEGLAEVYRAAERSLHGGPTDVAGRGMLPAQGPRMPAVAAGVSRGGAEARSLHGGPTDIAGMGAQVAGPLRSAAASPFAESFFFPDVVRPAVSLSPVVVEASRLPPVVEGVTMRRGAPGSGDFGERADLTPTVFRRDTPMGVEEATGKGLIYAVPLNREGPQDMTAASRINATPGMRAFDQEMRSEGALAMRERWQRESAARAAAAEMRATGRVGASKDIVAHILGEREADAASARRMREARVTPQVRDGVAYDPLTGKSAEVQRGGGAVRPTKWEEYTPKELGDMVNDAVRSMMPEGDSAAFKMALLAAKTDEERQEVYRKFQARPTPAQQLIMDTALAELEKRGGAKPQGGGAGGGGAVYKPGMFSKR